MYVYSMWYHGYQGVPVTVGETYDVIVEGQRKQRLSFCRAKERKNCHVHKSSWSWKNKHK